MQYEIPIVAETKDTKEKFAPTVLGIVQTNNARDRCQQQTA